MRVTRWIFGGLAALLILVLAALWFADTSTGHRLIVDRIARVAPQNGLRIRVGRIEGSIYGKARLVDVRFSDPNGLFLELPEARLAWRPYAWLANRLSIDSLVVPVARLARIPKFNPSASKGPLLPGFDIRVGHLQVDRLVVAQGVAGPQRSGRLTGDADIRSGRAKIHLDARLGGGDSLRLAIDAEPDANKFDVDTRVVGPAGGVIGKLVGTDRPVTLTVAGDGRYTDWHGRLVATASALPVADLALTQRQGRYDLAGTLRPSLVTQGKVQRLTAPGLTVKGNAALADRRLDLHLAIASPSLAVSANGVIDLANSAFSGMRTETRLLRPAAFLPNMRGRDVRLLVNFDGQFGTARFDYLLSSPQVAFDNTGFEGVRVSGQGRLSKTPVIVPIRLIARRVTGVGDVAGGILANLKVEGLLRVTSKMVMGDGLKLSSDKLNGKISILFDLATGHYDFGVAGQLGRYLIPGLGIVDVKSELHVVPGPGGHGTRVTGRGQAWVRRLDNAFLKSLAGGLPYIDTGLERDADGIVHFVNLQLRGPAIRLQGNGYRRKDGTFHFEGSGVQARYGPVRLILDGKIDRPHLDLRLARPFDALGLRDVHAILVPTAQGYGWQATGGGSRLGPFTGNGAILLPRGQAAVIQIATLNASGLKASGSLRSVPAGFDGTLALAGSGVSGSLVFKPQGDIQRIDADLAFKDAHLAGPPLITVRQGSMKAALLLDPAGLSTDATFQLAGVRYGAVSLGRLNGTAKLRGGTGEVRASVAGSRGRPFDLQTVAQISPNRIVVQARGTLDRRPLVLNQPAVLTYGPNGWTLAPTALTFAGGDIRVGGTFGGGTTAFDATLERLPLGVLDIAFPGLGLGGSASGTVSYRQSADGAAPSGTANLRFRSLTRSGLIASSQPIDLGINAVLNGSGLALRAVGESGGQIIGRAQMRAAPLGAGGTIIERIQNAPLFAQVRYNGPADTLWRLANVEGLNVSGPVAVGADISGTLARPQLRGSLTTNALRVESAASGTVLTNLKGTGMFSGSRLVIPQFTATAGRGTLSGRAAFSLSSAEGFGIDISGTAQDAELIRRDDIGATVTGPLAIKSQGASGLISGDVTVNRSSYRLGRATAAAAIPQLKVRELNRPADEAEPAAPPTTWRLAIKARIPNRLTVTGLGLDSEWRGDIDLGGTLTAMMINGRLEQVRGGYEFAGKRFDLQRGVIRFTGNSPPDPVIDVVANASVNSVNATVSVQGVASRPEITFASTPSLPQDELLSRILFGTSITNLSAPEALQLAAAVNGLRGGSGIDPINAIRKAVGLDRLRIVPADATTGQQTSIALGKYITRRAYVEVISDGAGYSATRAEFEVTRWLSLLSTISTIGRQSVSARISKDY
ncbi:Translocation/assembly module TamB [Sphingomonas antarctica]|uniref:translocation/assembly module TamB domain-containing protein n=1 Tax=Sphingomonas antarctica TaxID=2040274 RepID=UPI0039E9C2B7